MLIYFGGDSRRDLLLVLGLSVLLESVDFLRRVTCPVTAS